MNLKVCEHLKIFKGIIRPDYYETKLNLNKVMT